MKILAINSDHAHRIASVTDLQRAQYSEFEGTIRKPELRIENGIGIIPVKGMITKDGFYSWLFGGVNPNEIIDLIENANNNESVNRILLNIDSSGGEIAKIQELASAIRKSEKPVDAFVDGDAASGAYWIASAARKIYGIDTSEFGSIGAVIALYIPEDENRFEFVSSQSPLKRAKPSTDDGKDEYQTRVNDIADIFINDVAKNRNVTRETVLERFGQGGMVIARKAKDAGMIDGITTFQDYITGGYMENSKFMAALEKINTKIDKIEAAQQKQETPKPDIKTPEEIRQEAIEATLKKSQKMAADMRDLAQLAGVDQRQVVDAMATGKTMDEFRQICLDFKAKQTEKHQANSSVNPDVSGVDNSFATFSLDEEV